MQRAAKPVAPSKAQLQGELLRAQLQQTYYVQAMLDSSFRAQEQQAKAQIYKLWYHVEQLKKRTLQLQNDILVLNSAQLVDNVLATQEPILMQLAQVLPLLKECHDQLMRALKGTTYRLPTEGISCTSKEEVLLGDLVGLLTQLDHLLRASGTEVRGVSKHYADLQSAVGESISTIDSLGQLLAVATEMETMERSMKLSAAIGES